MPVFASTVRCCAVLFAVAFGLVFAPSEARAQRYILDVVEDETITYDAETSGWRASIEAFTDFPINAGGRLSVQTPSRFRFTTSLGFIPKPYVRAVNSVAQEAGAYPTDMQDVGGMAINSLRDSITWRLQGGMQPFENSGFYVEFGYMLAAVRGALNAEAVGAVLGMDASALPASASIGFQTFIHSITLELGWQWTFFDHLSFRFALGGMFAAGARTNFDNELNQATQSETTSAKARHIIDSAIETYGFAPVITTGIGYVF